MEGNPKILGLFILEPAKGVRGLEFVVFARVSQGCKQRPLLASKSTASVLWMLAECFRETVRSHIIGPATVLKRRVATVLFCALLCYQAAATQAPATCIHTLFNAARNLSKLPIEDLNLNPKSPTQKSEP